MAKNTLSETEELPVSEGYTIDPEVGNAIANFMTQHPPKQFPEKGDWRMLRKTLNNFYADLSQHFSVRPEVTTEDFTIKTSIGTEIKIRWYSPPGKTVAGPAIVYIHGGGRVSGSLELYDRIVSHFSYHSAVPFLSVDYSLSPEVQGEAQAEEAFSALSWLKKQAVEFEIDEHRIAVMGDSAGGGIAAATAILARDRKIHLSRQILIYPMLDDRAIIPDVRLLPFAVWTYDNNYTGWTASLGKDRGSESISPVAAPARLSQFDGLAPDFISVGDLDIFRNESLAYVAKLAAAGVAVEFHLHPGVPHGFDFIAPDAKVSQRAMADYIRAIQSF